MNWCHGPHTSLVMLTFFSLLGRNEFMATLESCDFYLCLEFSPHHNTASFYSLPRNRSGGDPCLKASGLYICLMPVFPLRGRVLCTNLPTPAAPTLRSTPGRDLLPNTYLLNKQRISRSSTLLAIFIVKMLLCCSIKI